MTWNDYEKLTSRIGYAYLINNNLRIKTLKLIFENLIDVSKKTICLNDVWILLRFHKYILIKNRIFIG